MSADPRETDRNKARNKGDLFGIEVSYSRFFKILIFCLIGLIYRILPNFNLIQQYLKFNHYFKFYLSKR